VPAFARDGRDNAREIMHTLSVNTARDRERERERERLRDGLMFIATELLAANCR